MASLDALKISVSESMGVPLATVNSWALMLRKDGLISSGGKGRTIEMTATDATNLMLPGLFDGLSTEAAPNVKRLRGLPLEECTLRPLDGWFQDIDRTNDGSHFYRLLPQFMRLADSRAAGLGSALDALMTGQTGCEVHEVKLSEFNSRLEAEIYIRQDSNGWVLRFAQGITRKGRTVSISIGGDEFRSIAATIGGIQ